MKKIKQHRLGMTLKKRGSIYTYYKVKIEDEDYDGKTFFQFYSMHYTMMADSYLHKLCLDTGESMRNSNFPTLLALYDNIDEWEEDIDEEWQYEFKTTFYIYDNKKEFERDMALSSLT